MAQNGQSKILSIEERIKKLKEQKNKEIAKMERNVGKRFLEKFNLYNYPLEDIFNLIDSLADQHHQKETDEQQNK